MMKLGRKPASTSTRASIDDVVVLPWVPAIAIVLRSATIASSIAARESTGIPRRRARRSSTLFSDTAVE